MAAKKTTKVEKTPVSSAQEEKLKALEHALSDLDKQFGKGSVMKLGERTEQNVQVIPTPMTTMVTSLARCIATMVALWSIATPSTTMDA